MKINKILLLFFTPILSFLLQKKVNKLKQKIGNSSLILYGAGVLSEFLVKNCKIEGLNIIGITDLKFISDNPQSFYGLKTISPEELSNISPDYIVLSVLEVDKIWKKSTYLKEYDQESILNLVDMDDLLIKYLFMLMTKPESILFLKPIVIKMKFFARKLTASQRVLPNFFVVGVAKGGTTSLSYYLEQHPQIHMNISGACGYYSFSDSRKKGELWYRAHLPKKSELSKGDIVGEIGNDCLFFPQAPERIKKLVPDAKIIMLLRNPTQRAISNYLFEKEHNKKCSSIPIKDALHFDNDYCNNNKDLNFNNVHEVYLQCTFLSMGIYIDQVKRFEKHFPKEQILIIQSEEFFKDTEKALKQIFDFLGVENNNKIVDLSPKNVGKFKKEVDPEIIDYLNKFFEPYNQQLYEHLGKDFGW